MKILLFCFFLPQCYKPTSLVCTGQVSKLCVITSYYQCFACTSSQTAAVWLYIQTKALRHAA